MKKNPAQKLVKLIMPRYLVDCRFSLLNSLAGAKTYRLGHIENARYAHLENDLSTAITKTSGRQQLPNLNLLTDKLGQWGINNRTQVIVYDDANGAISARLWSLYATWVTIMLPY